MERLCPLCQKKGLKNKISSFMLNPDEEVEMCENEKCEWPFGYEPLKFIPKMNLDLYKILGLTPNLPVIPISTELSLYTPPVTPVDNQETTTDVKGLPTLNHPEFAHENSDFDKAFKTPGITDSYASPATIVKDVQVSADPSPSIFDIDSPQKALASSRVIQSCDKKLVVVKSNNLAPGAVKKKHLPTVTNTETVTSLRILKRVPMKKGVVLKRITNPVMSNVNLSVVSRNTCGSSLILPNNVSEFNKLDTAEVSMQVEDKAGQSCQNLDHFNLDFQPDSSVNTGQSDPLALTFIKQEDDNLESIIEELQLGDSSQQMDLDDDWLDSLMV